MDSDQFSTASFEGSISNLKDVKFNKDGTYNVTVTGTLNIHGVTKPVETKGTVTVTGKSVNAMCDVSIKLDDYGVNGGAIAAGKVSKETKISVVADF